MSQEQQDGHQQRHHDRVGAVDALVEGAQAGDGAAVEALRAIVRDYRSVDIDTYTRALNRLWLFGDASLEAPLLAALADRGYGCQMWTARACGQLGFDRAAPALIDLLDAPDVLTREAVCQALGQLGTRAAVGPLAYALNDASDFVRAAAADALAAVGTDEALRHLWTALEAHRATRVGYLASAIATFSPAVLDRLLRAADDPDPDLRFWIARALGCTGDSRAVEPLNILIARDDAVTTWGARVATAARTGLKTLHRLQAHRPR